MTSKRKLRARIAQLEGQLVQSEAVTFSTLSVDFEARSIRWQGRTIEPGMGSRAVDIPILQPRFPVWADR